MQTLSNHAEHLANVIIELSGNGAKNPNNPSLKQGKYRVYLNFYVVIAIKESELEFISAKQLFLETD